MNRYFFFNFVMVFLLSGVGFAQEGAVSGLPVNRETLDKIIDRIGDLDENAKSKIDQIMATELRVKTPKWFLKRLENLNPGNRNGLKKLENGFLLSKPIFKFADGDDDTLEVFGAPQERGRLIVFSSDAEFKVDVANSELFKYREMGKSDYFIAKRFGSNVLLIGDTPFHPIGYFNSKGRLIWEKQICFINGHSQRMELECLSSATKIVIFASQESELVIQSFDFENGEPSFWWSSQFDRLNEKGKTDLGKQFKKR